METTQDFLDNMDPKELLNLQNTIDSVLGSKEVQLEEALQLAREALGQVEHETLKEDRSYKKIWSDSYSSEEEGEDYNSEEEERGDIDVPSSSSEDEDPAILRKSPQFRPDPIPLKPKRQRHQEPYSDYKCSWSVMRNARHQNVSLEAEYFDIRDNFIKKMITFSKLPITTEEDAQDLKNVILHDVFPSFLEKMYVIKGEMGDYTSKNVEKDFKNVLRMFHNLSDRSDKDSPIRYVQRLLHDFLVGLSGYMVKAKF